MNSAWSVYFDGLCPLCSREIAHYQKQTGAERLRFVDITSPGFDARRESLDPRAVHRVMHVRRPDGTLATGVDAFIEIWTALPRYQWAAKLARNRVLRPFLEAGYQAFARVRPYLPRKKAACEASPFCEARDTRSESGGAY